MDYAIRVEKNHLTKLKELRCQASTLVDEKFRNTMLEVIDIETKTFRETRFKNVNEMIDHVIRTENFIKGGIYTGLYGPLDPRTQKVIEAAELIL